MQTAKFDTASAAYRAILAGNSRFTLVSRATGARYTFKVSAAKNRDNRANGKLWFVSLLTGPNNEADFTYLGVLREGWGSEGVKFGLTAKSRAPPDSAPVKAIGWAIHAIYDRGEIPPTLEIWHEGRCCRCGRTLTVPESIATGLGPECAQHHAAAA